MADVHILTRRAAGALILACAAAPLGAQEAPRQVVEMSMGAADAPVTMIEYASFTCPHCANFHTSVLPQIKAAFIDPGKVRLVYREVYFDRPGVWASMIARCGGEARFFGVVDILFRDQLNWATADTAEGVVDRLFAIGRQAGMTDAQMSACLQDAEFAKALVAAYQANAEEHQIEATPSFVIDGEKVDNLPWPEFEARLNAALGS